MTKLNFPKAILNASVIGTLLLGSLASQPVLAAKPHGSLDQFTVGVQPGCAEGVFGPGDAVTYRLGGYADIASRRPIDEKTQFHVASMSKQFTALAIVLLQEKGLLRLSDPAVKWVPELSGAVQDASIEQLLHQTAGVRDHLSLIVLAGGADLRDVDRDATLRLMSRQKSTNFPPGSRAQYSNGNYFVLAEIVQRASGLPLDQFAARYIFKPLSMRNTQYITSNRLRRLAQGYEPQPEPPGYRIANDRPATIGSGGLITTLDDLRKFDADFRSERRVWRPAIKQLMLSPGRLNNGDVAILPEFKTPYGLGLGLADEGDDIRVFHDGGAEGFRSEYARMIKGGVSVAVLCNRVDGRAPAIAAAALQKAMNAKAPSPAARPAPETLTLKRAPKELLEKLAGSYRAEELAADYIIRVAEGGFEVTAKSPLTGDQWITDTWGDLALNGERTLVSGPLNLTLEAVNTPGVRIATVSLGKRAEGIGLARIPNE